jgi:hypothetical protein
VSGNDRKQRAAYLTCVPPLCVTWPAPVGACQG